MTARPNLALAFEVQSSKFNVQRPASFLFS
jgi:hypothetical protein